MPSPFPGIDPYIESQKWEDFHTQFITVLRESLVPRVRPQYLVDVERFVFVTKDDDEDDVTKVISPDTFIADTGHGWREAAAPRGTATLEPVRNRVRLPRRRQPFLVIRTRQHHKVVTVIELLSPWNKTHAGLAAYLSKRSSILYSTAHLVELDFLRGGERLPTEQPLQPGDFYAFISRVQQRPELDVFAWTLRDPLPTLPIPLADPDPDVLADLQDVFVLSYDRAGYDYTLDYSSPVLPPLSAADAEWAQSILSRQSTQ